MKEFELIEKYFAPLSRDGLQNDAAVLTVPKGKELVVTSDTLTAGVHFLDDQPPETIAQKALRVNLSDLASMGAEPCCYQLCLSMPENFTALEEWLQKFSAGLKEEQNLYGVFLSGGDTNATPGPLSIAITALGHVDEGKALSRAGAKSGDVLVLTGTVGDAFCGLKALRENIDAPELIKKYYMPDPPLDMSGISADNVHAAIDISDGLVQDLGHMCKASNLTAILNLETMAFSSPVQDWLEKGIVALEDVLTGGDDYKLLLAIGPDNLDDLQREYGMLQVVGHFESGPPKVRLFKGEKELHFSRAGWQHFY